MRRQGERKRSLGGPGDPTFELQIDLQFLIDGRISAGAVRLQAVQSNLSLALIADLFEVDRPRVQLKILEQEPERAGPRFLVGGRGKGVARRNRPGEVQPSIIGSQMEPWRRDAQLPEIQSASNQGEQREPDLDRFNLGHQLSLGIAQRDPMEHQPVAAELESLGGEGSLDRVARVGEGKAQNPLSAGAAAEIDEPGRDQHGDEAEQPEQSDADPLRPLSRARSLLVRLQNGSPIER